MLNLLFAYFLEDVKKVILMDCSNWYIKMPDKMLVYTGCNCSVLEQLLDKQFRYYVDAQVAMISEISRNNVKRGFVSCKAEEFLLKLLRLDPYVLRISVETIPF